MLHHFRLTVVLRLRQQTAGLVTGLCLSINVFAQISPSQERDIGIRNQQELQRQQQQEQQQRQRRRQPQRREFARHSDQPSQSKNHRHSAKYSYRGHGRQREL